MVTMNIKIRFTDLKKMKRVFPAERNEYLWHYFMRVRQFMQEHIENPFKKQLDWERKRGFAE